MFGAVDSSLILIYDSFDTDADSIEPSCCSGVTSVDGCQVSTLQPVWTTEVSFHNQC